VKVAVDMSLCEHLGECCYVAPEVFHLDDSDRLVFEAEPGDDLRAKVSEAAGACPTMAIVISD
jgi:ferredoxin